MFYYMAYYMFFIINMDFINYFLDTGGLLEHFYGLFHNVYCHKMLDLIFQVYIKIFLGLYGHFITMFSECLSDLNTINIPNFNVLYDRIVIEYLYGVFGHVKSNNTSYEYKYIKSGTHSMLYYFYGGDQIEDGRVRNGYVRMLPSVQAKKKTQIYNSNSLAILKNYDYISLFDISKNKNKIPNIIINKKITAERLGLYESIKYRKGYEKYKFKIMVSETDIYYYYYLKEFKYMKNLQKSLFHNTIKYNEIIDVMLYNGEKKNLERNQKIYIDYFFSVFFKENELQNLFDVIKYIKLLSNLKNSKIKQYSGSRYSILEEQRYNLISDFITYKSEIKGVYFRLKVFLYFLLKGKAYYNIGLFPIDTALFYGCQRIAYLFYQEYFLVLSKIFFYARIKYSGFNSYLSSDLYKLNTYQSI